MWKKKDGELKIHGEQHGDKKDMLGYQNKIIVEYANMHNILYLFSQEITHSIQEIR